MASSSLKQNIPLGLEHKASAFWHKSGDKHATRPSCDPGGRPFVRLMTCVVNNGLYHAETCGDKRQYQKKLSVSRQREFGSLSARLNYKTIQGRLCIDSPLHHEWRSHASWHSLTSDILALSRFLVVDAIYECTRPFVSQTM
jgi:hypothetical protein